MTYTSPIPHEASGHLLGVVSIWLTNGNKPVDAGNDTRYDFFSGGWIEAFQVTEWLIENGYLRWATERDKDDYVDDVDVVPTAKGLAAAMGRW